jgi:hypothetical protein
MLSAADQLRPGFTRLGATNPPQAGASPFLTPIYRGPDAPLNRPQIALGVTLCLPQTDYFHKSAFYGHIWR